MTLNVNKSDTFTDVCVKDGRHGLQVLKSRLKNDQAANFWEFLRETSQN